ncbi:hypothetical protein PIB30_016689 [Stylosanthes scabra]|uniref:VQ domain-containing protein n=1 Tax=Stylosanthes scabra TaxID=79078 RepID=A0ABU6X5S8_9FABA|nr:hypothetical protein [Stylosanthes scabra]
MGSLGKSSAMNNGVQQRAPTKRSNNKQKKRNSNNNKKEIKVVYISNPMKVKTSASQFRALVQELTGQDAEFPQDPSKFQGQDCSDNDGDNNNNHNGKGDYDDNNYVVKDGHDGPNDDTLVVIPPPSAFLLPEINPNFEGKIVGRGGEGGGTSSIESFEPFDEVFTPQMIESISSLLPSSVYHESPQLDQVVMQFNYVHQ